MRVDTTVVETNVHDPTGSSLLAAENALVQVWAALATGCEGPISGLKRGHGLDRCRYRGFKSMQRWVDLGVIAYNLIQIGRYLAVQRA
jgi:Transposase DDE domain